MFKKSMKYDAFTKYLFLSHCLLESKNETQRAHLSEAIAKNLVYAFFTVRDDIVRDHLITNLKNNLNKKIDDFQGYVELILSKYAESQELTGVIVFERLMSCLLELEKSLSQFGKNIKNDLKFFENTLNEEDKIRSFIIYEPDTMVSEKVETPPIPELIVLRKEKTYDSEDEEEDKVLQTTLVQVRGALDQNTQATTRYLDKNSIWKSMYDYFQKKSPEEKKKYQNVQDSADYVENHKATISALFSVDFFKVFGMVDISIGLIFVLLVRYVIEKVTASVLSSENDARENFKITNITNFVLLSISAALAVFLFYSYFQSKGHIDKHTSEKMLAEKEFERILNETFSFKYNEPSLENKVLKKTENPVFEYIPNHLILAAYQSKKKGKVVVGKTKANLDEEVVLGKTINDEAKKSDVNPNIVQKIMTEQNIGDLNGYQFIEVISEHINKEILCLHEKILKSNTVSKLYEQFEDVIAKMKEKPQFVGPTGEQGIAKVAKPPEVTVFFGDQAYTGSIIYKFKGATEVRAALVKLSLQVESQKITFLIPVYGFKTLDHEPPESYMNNTFRFPALPFLSKPTNSMAKAREHFGVFTGNNNNKPKASDNNNETQAQIKEVNQPGF